MQQLTQKLRDGIVVVSDVPMPVVADGAVLVRNHYSLVSPGTEGGTVKAARKGLIGKAKERPQQVKQVFDVLRTQGVSQTIRAVTKKLESLSPLGYSCSGEVIGIGRGVSKFKVGDFVACGGLTASHAEAVSVPSNLCVKLALDDTIDPTVQLKLAAYNTLGAIALQGLRQADLRLGETCAVIGLGLIGQLTCLMLRASGVKVVGVDVDASVVRTARDHCADLAFERSDSSIVAAIDHITNGLGVDAVIVAAGSMSLDPINFAGEICRQKGRVVVVGAVPTGFDRDPHYYRKELDLRMSCSYGPGRYDLGYEEKGLDYPAAYVRWTENRNMQAFQELVLSGNIDLGYLTTHEFALEDAPKAYDLILGKSEPHLGILIRYDFDKPVSRKRIEVGPVQPVGSVNIGFIGAGSYAQGNLLPNIPKTDRSVVRRGVMTSSGTTSKRVAERFGFEFCTSTESDLLDDNEINTVFVATRHDSHAEYVAGALRSSKNVFVEKPLCISESELEDVEAAYSQACEGGQMQLLVGFNRRFSPLARFLKKELGDGPMSMLYRVNAGSIGADSWIQDKEVGGGRIIGEVCHFVDLCTYLCGSLPTRVYASALPDPDDHDDNVNINLEFENGSIGTISYFADGSKSLAKEYVEVHRGGVSGILRDFREAEIYSKGRPKRKKSLNQDKGQATMVHEFVNSVRDGTGPLIPMEEIAAVTRATFRIVESIHERKALDVRDS